MVINITRWSSAPEVRCVCLCLPQYFTARPSTVHCLYGYQVDTFLLPASIHYLATTDRRTRRRWRCIVHVIITIDMQHLCWNKHKQPIWRSRRSISPCWDRCWSLAGRCCWLVAASLLLCSYVSALGHTITTKRMWFAVAVSCSCPLLWSAIFRLF